VYAHEGIAPEKLIGVAIHPADAEAVLRELVTNFHRLHLPLYDDAGNVLWPPPAGAAKLGGRLH
jgi:hypothetical protein